MADLISMAAAIDALTDENIEMNFDSVYDGEIHRTKRAAMRIVANLPTIDAIPVEWIMKLSNKRYRETKRDVSIVDVLEAWQKEQEAR